MNVARVCLHYHVPLLWASSGQWWSKEWKHLKLELISFSCCSSSRRRSRVYCCCSSNSSWRLHRNASIIASKHAVLVFASKISALKAQSRSKNSLSIICYIMWRFSSCTCELLGQLVEEGDLIDRPRVHEEEERIHAFPSGSSGAMKHRHTVVHGNWGDLVCQLREEGREP